MPHLHLELPLLKRAATICAKWRAAATHAASRILEIQYRYARIVMRLQKISSLLFFRTEGERQAADDGPERERKEVPVETPPHVERPQQVDGTRLCASTLLRHLCCSNSAYFSYIICSPVTYCCCLLWPSASADKIRRLAHFPIPPGRGPLHSEGTRMSSTTTHMQYITYETSNLVLI